MMSNYAELMQQKGISLSSINHGSIEMALSVSDAYEAIELLRDNYTVILGGDILSEKNGDIIYAYQFWGEEYIYLNWYCENKAGESNTNYARRSYEVAKEAVTNAHVIANKLNQKCYIVFVI